jgi:hypothetical protein
MPIADSYEPLKSSANGSTQDFSFDFYIGSTSNLRIYEEDDVTLVQTLKALTTDYTATFDDETPGGNVHFLVAPAAGKSIIRAREIPKTQEVPLKTSKGFQALVLQNIVDKLTALVQDVSEAVNRAVKLPLGTTVTAVTLPEPEDDSLIAWDGVAGAMKNLAADDFIGATGPVGPQGPQGIQGPQGDQGIQGPAGAVATVDTDGTMAANSDAVVPSQKAVRTYVAAEIPDYNSKAEAEAGTVETGMMNPLRVAQAIAALAPANGSLVDYSSTSTFLGFSSFSSKSIKYIVNGKLAVVFFTMVGTSNATGLTFTLPSALANKLGFGILVSSVVALDNGSWLNGHPYIEVANDGTTVTAYTTAAGAGWTNSGTKALAGYFMCAIA